MSNNYDWIKEIFGDIVFRQKSILATYDLYRDVYTEVMAGKEIPAKLWACSSVVNDHTEAVNKLSYELFSSLDNTQHITLNSYENIFVFIPEVGGAWLTIWPPQVTVVNFDDYIVSPSVLCLGGLPPGTMIFTNNITLTIP